MSGFAVITGATSGIGAAFAEILGGKGHSLLLTGRRRKILEDFAANLRLRLGIIVETAIVELANPPERSQLCERLKALDQIDYLVNNAGFGLSLDFGDKKCVPHLEMIEVHIKAPLELTNAVLPGMKNRGSGAIINVSSVASFFPMPRGTTYSATKAFLNTFSESLALELTEFNIAVQALCPGMTRTYFHDRMGLAGKEIEKRNILGWMAPDTVAARSIHRLRRKRVIFIPGVINKFLVAVFSRLPRCIYYPLVRRIMTKKNADM